MFPYKKYTVGKPNIQNREKFLDRVTTILDSKWLTNNGPMVQELETKVAKFTKTKHCIAMTNASIALELVLSDLPPGEVIIPTFTFIATAHSVTRAGHIPVFVDVEDDFLINVEEVEKNITQNTVAIVPVNLFGSICDPEVFDYFTDAYEIPVIYDSAHSLGCNTGNNGLAEVFSLHATKICNGFEGGLVTTNEDNLAIRLRQFRNFGYVGHIPDIEGEIVGIGTNAKLSEIHAAAALTNFEEINKLASHNKFIWSCYEQFLPKEIILDRPNPFDTSNFSYIACLHPKRDDIVSYLRGHHITARKYFKHLCHEVYQLTDRMPHAERLAREAFCLPTGMDIELEDVQHICSVIGKVLAVLP